MFYIGLNQVSQYKYRCQLTSIINQKKIMKPKIAMLFVGLLALGACKKDVKLEDVESNNAVGKYGTKVSAGYSFANVAIGGGGFVSAIITNPKETTLMYARTDVGGAYRYDRANSKWIPLMDWASDQQQGMFGTESLASDPLDPRNLYISAGISYFNNGNSYILRSTDYGANFQIIDVTAKFKINGNGMGRQNGEKLVVDPNKNSILFCGSRSNGLWKSTDYGNSWNPAGNIPSSVTTTVNDNGISFVAMDKSSAVLNSTTTRIFVGISRPGSNNNLYRSDDGGNTFTAINNTALPATFMPQRAVVGSNGFLYVTYGNGAGPHGGYGAFASETYDQGQVWKYNISNGSWTNVTPISSSNRINRAFCGISVDPSNSQRILASTTNTYLQQGDAYGDRFYISTDGGTNWIDVVARGFNKNTNGVSWIAGNSIHWAGCIVFDPSSTNRVWVTSGNGVFVNNDINASAGTWDFMVKDLEETVPMNVISIPGGPLISSILDYDGFRHTNIFSYAPRNSPTMGSTYGLDYGATNKNKVVRVGSSMYYSNDMGVTWTQTSSINGSKGQVAVSADGNVILHCPESSTTTYRSANNGSSWSAVSGISINTRPVADGFNSAKFYAYNGSTGELLMSTNGGSSFAKTVANPGTGGSAIIRTVPGKEGNVWVALNGGGLTYTQNSGGSFTKILNVSNCLAVGIGKAATGATYETVFIYGVVGGITGIFRSIDKGANWIRMNDDAHEYGGPGNGTFIVGDMNTFDRVYMSTAGRGIVVGSGI